jgi:catechol 2,3-dioxygenase-like lactoylglutathione lyase family enzyme
MQYHLLKYFGITSYGLSRGFKSSGLIGLWMVSMTNEVLLNHVAVECVDQQSADLFFTTILGMSKIKSTILSKESSAAIFRIDTNVAMEIYDNGQMRIEVFIKRTKREPTCAHLCIEVDHKHDFVTQCKHHGLEPFFVEKDGKQLLFVRDFSDNLYEIK